MDSNPICHPSPAKNMKSSFLEYIQLLMIGRAGRWTRTPSATPLQQKKLNAHSKIMFNFWWLAGLVDGLKPNLPPLSSQKNEMLVFGLPSTSDDWPGWSMDSNPICHPSPAKKMKCSFLDYIQLLMFNRPGRWIWTPSATPLIASKNMKCSFLDYIQLPMIGQAGQWTQTPSATPLQWKNKMLVFGLPSMELLMIGRAGRWTWTPSTTSLQPKKWNAHFWITFNFWWLARLVNGLKPHLPPLSSEKMKCSFLDYIQLLMIGQLVHGLEPHLPPLSSQKNEMLIFGLRSTSDDQEGWLIDSNPICHPFPAKIMKCSFLDCIQLLMIRRAGWSTQTPSATPLQRQKWNAHFLDYVQLLMISWTGQWTQMPSTTPLQL